MYISICCREMLGLFLGKTLGFPLRSTTTSVGNSTRYFSSKIITLVSVEKDDSFTVKYLINSCGLSSESATSISKKLHFETPERPDSVLALLHTYGFTKSHISRLVKANPSLLLADPHKTLFPKLDFFSSIGLSSSDLPRIVSSRPYVLSRSLENHLIPYYNFLKSLGLDDEKVVKTLRRSFRAFGVGFRSIAPNICMLREFGIPESTISSFLTRHTNVLLLRQDKFKEIAEDVVKWGFHPSKPHNFLVAMLTVSAMSKLTWERKIEIYSNWGLSKDDCLSMFKKHPICMCFSEKKIMATMDFFVNRMGWNATAVSRSPQILNFSLKKRIIPRCSLLRVLITKGLIKEELNPVPVHVLTCTDNYFTKNYVSKYEEFVPGLLCFYQGKITLSELGFQSEDIYYYTR